MSYTQFHGTGSVTLPDKVIRERYFKDYGYAGTYLDVGAAGPINMSNSYHFRRNGWRILSVEANPEFCKMHRDMGFEIAECAVAEESRPEADFSIIVSGPPEAASSLGGTERDWGKDWSGYHLVNEISHAEKRIIRVKVLTLDDVMRNFFPDVEKIDVLDVDVELGEMGVLKGFDLAKHRPEVCVIEDHKPELSGIGKHMKERGYRLDYMALPDSYYVRAGTP